ncbi:MAG TPA: translation initiation factor IF-2 [Verrucomicrobiae bacterium]|nr:translation initiation factor IF-2 [Verrucomicrobiae bacterium]
MSVRVHDLAKHCGLTNKEMLDKLRSMNYPVKSHSSTVDKITAEAIEMEYGYVPPAPEPTPAPAPAPMATPVEAPAPTTATAPPKIEVAPPKAPVPAAPKPLATPAPKPETAAPAHAQVTLPRTAPAAKQHRAPAAVARSLAPATLSPKPAAKPAPAKPVVPPPPKPVVPAAPAPPAFTVDDKGNRVIQMKPPVVVRDLALRVGTKPHLLLAELMELNVFANLNETIGEDIARKICERHGFVFELEKRERGAGAIHAPPKKVMILEEGVKTEDLRPRPPVVTVMGHVDHGKTSLLDAIRKTNVVAGETGGITQHIGASVVTLPDGKTITFLDTPGHEAFTKMRARGANVTDIAILVVAADDGVMPQTLEAINHAKAAQVPIIVAVNKVDLAAANPDRVKKQLQELGLSPESWGGETITVDVSATTKKNLDTLLEMILLQAEIMELKATPKGPAKGNVIEAQLEPGMGPTATVLVRKGTLKVGDAIICGPHGGKVRALINDKGHRVKEALPSMPVKIVGLQSMPEAGAEFQVVKNEKEARELSEQRQLDVRGAAAAQSRTGARLEDIMSQIQEGEKKKLRIILKADVQGSLEAINDSLAKLKSDKIELEIIHGAVGSITENDVLLASASDAVLIGFRVKTESGVTDMAKRDNVQIKLYTIIYELIEQVEEAMEGLLEPESKEAVVGHAEVRKIFELSKGPLVAGCVVTDGRIARSGRVRVLRRKAVQFEGRIGSLKHFQDDVKEVKAGTECGLRLENFSDLQVGDVIECYTVEKVAATL